MVTPARWDWTPARVRIGHLTSVEHDALQAAVNDLHTHLAAGGVNPDSGHAEALWLGARCAIDVLAPLLYGATGPNRTVQALVTSKVNALEDIASQARQQWHRPGQPWPELLQQVERARADHGSAP
jgi:hypothetical protein